MVVSGFLIRSQAIRGWPMLQVDGYSDTDDSGPPDVAKLRLVHLSPDVLLCLFDGPVRMIAIHEPPEQLDSGFEYDADDAGATTTLRATSGANPGQPFPVAPHGEAEVPLRADALTIRAHDAGAAIRLQLNTYFDQRLEVMTANEFALEMVKGVVRVEYVVGRAA